MAIFLQYPHMVERGKGALEFSFRRTINHFPRAPLPNTITLEIKFQHMNFRDINIHSIAKSFSYDQSCSLYCPHKNFTINIYTLVIYLPVVLNVVSFNFHWVFLVHQMCLLLLSINMQITSEYTGLLWVSRLYFLSFRI